MNNTIPNPRISKKVDVTVIKNKLLEISARIKLEVWLKDPKKRLFIIAGAVVSLLVFLLIIGIIFKAVNNKAVTPKPTPNVSETPNPSQIQESLETRLRNLREEITGPGFEDKSIAVPDIDFKVVFDLN